MKEKKEAYPRATKKVFSDLIVYLASIMKAVHIEGNNSVEEAMKSDALAWQEAIKAELLSIIPSAACFQKPC